MDVSIDAMKQRIIEKATSQLLSGGYDALNFSEIAKDLDITRANIHHHFTNKEGLALDVLSIYEMRHAEFMTSLAIANPDNFPNFIAAMEQAMIQMITESNGKCICMCTQIVGEANIPDQIKLTVQGYFDRATTLFEELIIASQKKGTLTKDIKPKTLALMTHTFLIGIIRTVIIGTNNTDYMKALPGMLTEWISHYQPIKNINEKGVN
ncbi:TetR/AcrR family transcriptional regulator [bacterium]|mgnify:FL=1|nr:TetR/AcrR family transcriptional regulator [bacterium]